MAVCVVGQPRSAARTARTIRRHVLNVLDADAFLVSQLKDSLKQSKQSLAIEQLLGPRVRIAVHGTEQQLQPAGLVSKLVQGAAAQHVKWTVADFGVKWAGLANNIRQRLNHVMCLSLMRHAEAADGIPYTLYARTRLDSMFFAPLPPSVLELALVPGAAVVPTGDAWGGGRGPHWGRMGRRPGGGPRFGVCDRMLIGRWKAFAADVYGWLKPFKRSSSHLSGPTWCPETYQRAILEKANVTIFRVKLAYATVSVGGRARYGEHLSNALDICGPGLLRDYPAVCPCNASAPTSCAQGDASKRCIRHIQTAAMRAADPGFCMLARLCKCCKD